MGMLFEGLLIILWMQLTRVSGQQLNQSPRSMSISEGEAISMSCISSSTFSTLLWYKQDAGGGPVLLITLYKGGEFIRNGKLTAQFGGTRKDSFLNISAPELADAGTYFCAGQHSAPLVPAACTQTCNWDPSHCAASSSCSSWHEM
ncbi:T-cell receptor alpha chain V region CTL-L17 [Myotis davidii]|nr:T-cell receptor alpha chain V region CTL-L17 [Myotis davidii]